MVHHSFASANPDFLPKVYQEADLPEALTEIPNVFCTQLLRSAAGNSPYLAKLLEKYTETAFTFCEKGADASFSALFQPFEATDEASLMRELRDFKHRAALIIALADIGKLWNLRQVTSALSEVAETSLNVSLNYLLEEYQSKQGLVIESPESGSGLIVLAMGKLGAYELNYSSDVDLILLYETDKFSHARGRPVQRILNRLAQDYIRLMQDRTGDGYVFRMDLRLRPDPASTPLVMTTESAFRYYESVGQNWERAAFIKARPIAGDLTAGDRFLQELQPFIWRKSLDFASLADIQSIKRQMDRAFQNQEFEVAGYDVKKGIGGIREIEFLAQVHQLIWGGRRPELRTRRTMDSYVNLQKIDLVTAEETQTMRDHYLRLREIEHRLQMVHDAQTHEIPIDETDRKRIAFFCSHETLSAFEQEIQTIAREVHHIYSEAFTEHESLAGDGKLSFTGGNHDPDTLRTLHQMGFQEAEAVSDTIRSWHRGSIRAMRSSRARELLTELTPSLLKHIGSQAEADLTFQRFAKFFSQLPAGITFLSLLYNRPELLEILTTIIGNAPQMAQYLAKHPDWLDALLSLSPNSEQMEIKDLAPLEEYRARSLNPEETASWLCRYRCEHEFVMGCQLLAGTIDPLEMMPVFSRIADRTVEQLCDHVIESFEGKYGRIEGSGLSIVALGRLASEELTFGSDLDLLFLYDAADETVQSDGKRSLGVAPYYNRLAQRIIGQLTAQTPEGRLYEVDSRLRPAGSDGPLAVNLRALKQYYKDSAWTFERMALTRHRVIYTSPKGDKERYARHLVQVLQQPSFAEVLCTDALEMRKRIWKEFPAPNEWKVKHTKGGLIDIAFIAQVLALQHGATYPAMLSGSPQSKLRLAIEHRIMKEQTGQALLESLHYQMRVQTVLRLCHSTELHEAHFSDGLKRILTSCLTLKDFHLVQERLQQHQQTSYSYFNEIIGEYP